MFNRAGKAGKAGKEGKKEKKEKKDEIRLSRREAEREPHVGEASQMNVESKSKDYWRMRSRILTQERTAIEFRSQVRNGETWDRDWSLPSRSITCQRAFAKFIVEKLPPDFIVILWAGGNPSAAVSFRMLRELRNSRNVLYDRSRFPTRASRQKFEYIAAFETGLHPKAGNDPINHLHVLLYNADGMEPKKIQQVWTKIGSVNGPSGCLVRRFRTKKSGRGYDLKTYGTNADKIVISHGLPSVANLRISQACSQPRSDEDLEMDDDLDVGDE